MVIMSYSGNGVKDWIVQRISSIITGAYVLFLLAFLIAHPGLDYLTWVSLFSHLGMKIFTILTLLSVMLHAWIGIWTVLTDYVKVFALRALLEIIIIIALFAYFVWGIAIVWSV